MSTKYIVNNLSGQTINGNPIDPRYKVFTALLTQSGGDAPTQVGSGNILEGVRYSFAEYEVEGWDFTNVGGPKYPASNNFTATVTAAPILWGGVTLEYNAGTPVATVLENTIGNVWFNYTAAGVYTMASDGLFSTEKTLGFITYNDGGPSGLNDKPFLSIYPNNDYNIYVNSALDGVLSDSVLFYAPIEIRVYN